MNHAVLAALLALWIAVPLNQSFSAKVLSVLDGDTIDVLRDGQTVRIRLEGIDCPERDQPFAEEAKAFASNLLAGKTVTIVERERDQYGRTVARVFADGKDASVELLKAGLATHYKQHSSDWLLAALESQAKAERVGMWATGGITGSPTFQAQRQVPAKSIPAGIVYHGNVSSRVFHKPSCPNYNCKNCTRVFNSREEAIAAGFRPCGFCKP